MMLKTKDINDDDGNQAISNFSQMIAMVFVTLLLIGLFIKIIFF
jgi:hypothetical protein